MVRIFFSIALLFLLTGEPFAKGMEKCVLPMRVGHIVGLGGSILVSTNGGKTWKTQSTSDDKSLTSVEFVNNDTGFATGKDNQILLSADGGISWTRKSLSYERTFYDCTMSIGPNSALIGRRKINLSYAQSTDFEHVWTRQSSGTDTTIFCSAEGSMINYYDCTWFDSATAVVVGGHMSKEVVGGEEQSIIMRTTDCGNHWDTRSAGENALLYCVAAGSGTHGVAVGDSGMISITHDGGLVWRAIQTGSHNRLRGVDYLDSLTYIAVGLNGTILRSTDGGETWRESSSAVTADLRHIAFSPSGNGIAVGDNGTIFRSLDGGRSWVPKESGTRFNLLAADFFNDNVVVAIGDKGTMLRSEDSGDHWVELDRITNEALTRVSFVLQKNN